MAKKYQNSLLKKPVIKDKSLLRHEEIKKNIVIEPTLESLIPPLREEEHAQLESNILKEGCREALVIWQQKEGRYVLIDGHNRYGICQKHSLDFRVNLMEFDDLEAAKAYMVENQLGRRNLTPEQASYLRGVRYNQEKMGRGGYDRKQMAQNGPNGPKPTSERLAEEYSVSKNTIKRDAAFAAGIDRLGENSPKLKREILAGNLRLKKSDVQQLATAETLPKFSGEQALLRFLQELGQPLKKTAPKTPEKKQLPSETEASLKQAKSAFSKLQRALYTENTSEISTYCDELIHALQALRKIQ